MTTPNTIVLIKQETSRREEFKANAALKPGHLLKVGSNGKAKKHDSAGGWAERLFAEEDALQGKTITDAYAADDIVTCHLGSPGDVIYARVPASAPAITLGDALVSNGDGTFIKPTSLGSHTLYANTAASAAVTNTTVATAFDKSYTIPANLLAAGDIIRIQGQGICTATHSTDTLAVAVKIGSTTLFTIPATNVADNDIFAFDVTLQIRTIGSSGTFVMTGTYTTFGASGTAAPVEVFKASTTIDTTATQAITVVATWSVADVGNSVRLDVLNVERLLVTPQELLVSAVEDVDNSLGVAEAFIRVRCL